MTGKRANGEGSIYAYKNGYAAYAWIVTPAGRKQRKYVYGKTREDVHAKWLKLHQAAKRGPVASTVPQLGAYLEGWLRDVVEPNLAPNTASNYAMFSRLYIVPDLGKKRLDRLTIREVQQWLNVIRARCTCCAQGKDAARAEGKRRCCAAGECCRQRPSEWTVHQAWTVLCSALSNAVRDELVPRNVAGLVQVALPRPKKPKPWTVDEARQFLESAHDAGDPFYAAYVLVLTLGLRRGEVLGLGWDEIDLAKRELQIAWQLQRAGGALVRRETKTEASEATLPLPGLTEAALVEHRARQNRQRLAAGEAWQGNGLVFCSRYGRPIDPRAFHRAFKARCVAAGVPAITVHTTRRTCASLLVALDVHPRVAMQILRHSAIAVTMNIYSQVYSTETAEALRKLGEQLDTRADLSQDGDEEAAS